MDAAKDLRTALEDAGKELVPLSGQNLVDKVWGSARPAQPQKPLRIHKLEHAGTSVSDKIKQLRSTMTRENLSLGFPACQKGTQKGSSGHFVGEMSRVLGLLSSCVFFCQLSMPCKSKEAAGSKLQNQAGQCNKNKSL